MVLIKDFSIRPMTESDLHRVLQWRNSERVRINSLSDELISWESHFAWFSRLITNETQQYCIVEYLKVPIGVVYFRDIGDKDYHCTWGLYVGDETAPRGSGTQIGILGLTLAFETLNVRNIYAEVLGFNEISVRLHERLGFKRKSDMSRRVLKNGDSVEVVAFVLTTEDWSLQREQLVNRAE